ncbi:tail fiber protein [Paludibacterium purpuratum]|uniref:Microcystin-dependent protein n=1 Tax=Paludibacterium purpuratum TaxID=1144873 RepID=A0A4R7BEN1_9NEIS|nr:tail fiber protein [Paludibacterium purpuratum]TDR82216.1 microcystin-dependent protein [Paludibacterium purpuratum]
MVAAFNQTNFTTQDSATYKASIDTNFAVLARNGQMFAPHAAASPNMTMAVDPGYVFDGINVTTQSLQTTSQISAPVSNPRIDLVVCDIYTGQVSVVSGSEAASPSAPAIPQGKFPVAQVLLAVGVQAITSGMITDVRCVTAPPERSLSGSVITSAYSAQTTDLGRTLKFNGSFSASLSATLGAGWWANIKNVGSGVITFTPTSGTIDGAASVQLNAGQGGSILFDGANFYSFGLGGAGNPTGTIISSACASPPTGYLACDGSAVSRAAYSSLFAAIGTTFGAGDGSTTFNVPDARGVALRGVDGSRGLDSGRTLGSYQADAIASHSVGVSDPGHAHSGIVTNNTQIGNNGSGTYPNGGKFTVSASSTYSGVGTAALYNNQGQAFGTTSSTTSISASYSGAAETRMKNLAVNFFIKY